MIERRRAPLYRLKTSGKRVEKLGKFGERVE
jgi:hypothetical protein